MESFQFLGFAAAACTTAAFVPQVILILRSGSTDGISLGMYLLFTLGVLFWLSYGYVLGSVPMILANLITFTLASVVLILTLRQRFFLSRRKDLSDDELHTDVSRNKS